MDDGKGMAGASRGPAATSGDADAAAVKVAEVTMETGQAPKTVTGYSDRGYLRCTVKRLGFTVMVYEFDTSTRMKMKTKMKMKKKRERPGKVPRETGGVGSPSRPPRNPDAEGRVRSCPFPSGERTDFSLSSP
jgi:hypothetical protein